MKRRFPSGRTAHRLGLVGTIASTLLLVWLSLGVGIIGADDDPGNRMYLRAVAIGLLGATVVRFRPRGMAFVAFGVALAVAAIGGDAIAAGLGRPFSGPLELALLNPFFVAALLGSAALFRRSNRGEAASGDL